MATFRRSRLALTGALIASAVVIAALPAEASQPQQGRPGAPSLTVGDATAFESDGVVAFPLTLSAPAATPLRVTAVPLPGTARPALDYRPGSVSTVIPAGATAGVIAVPIVDDDSVEVSESFTLRIGAAPGAVVRTRSAVGTIEQDPVTVDIVHINDHHSNLAPTPNTLNLGTAGGAFTVPFGGFPQVTAKIAELEATGDEVVTVHAGDAITGTLFYTLFQGEADAALMNTVCFDVFALGNHEFDDGDDTLAGFLDFLNSDPDCETATISANVIPEVGTPLAPTAAGEYVRPFVIKEIGEQYVAFVGITIAGKTQNSSQPFPTTQFLDEVETTQRYVDELAARGIDNVVLVSHQGYENDIALARAVTGVDAVIGGDSHSLLGDFAKYGLPSQGEYPTITTNLAGSTVCVAQAWQYSWVVGELSVTFDTGRTGACDGTPHLLLSDSFTRNAAPIAEPERSAILAAIAADPQLSIVAPDAEAQAVLQQYADQVTELSKRVIGTAGEVLCDRRVPNVPRGASPCNANAIALSGAQLAVNGGFSQQVVTDAFFARSFRADLALQNGGGVRITIPAGPITIGTAYTNLPFSNTLVELDLSGQEVLDSIEDALHFYATNPGSNSGAFPYGSHIRWDIDMTQPRGSRASNVEVRERGTDNWTPIDPAGEYVVVTNSFIASGRDGYVTFGEAFREGRVTDTFINYAQGFIDYIVEDLGGGVLVAPAPENFSTQSFIRLS